MGIAAAVVLGYLLGTFPSADLVTRLASHGRMDIRAVGSGNPGALNALQSVGTGWGIVVLVLDVGKGMAAGFVGRAIGGDTAAYLGATAAIVGHVFPVWTGFRGGKGVATSAGACIAVFPAYVPINFVVAMLGALRARQAVVGTRIGCAIWMVASVSWWGLGWSNLWGPEPTVWLVVFSFLGAGTILWAFRHGDRTISPAE